MNHLRSAATAAVPATAALLGLALPNTASASTSDGPPDFAPVPTGSLGPALNAQGYFVGRISGHLYWVTDSFYQAMFLATREGAVLVDAPPTLGHNLLRAIQDVTDATGTTSRVTHLIYSHNHADHIGAAALFGNRVERIGQTRTGELLRAAADPNRPAPTLTFEDTLTVEVGGERLELAYHGPNHSPDNIFVHAPDHATLMLVDVAFPGWVPFKHLAESQGIPGWITAHDIALDYRWTTLVGGHLGRLGTRADVHLQKDYVTDLEASVRTTLSTLDPTPYFARYGPTGNAWAIFRPTSTPRQNKRRPPSSAAISGDWPPPTSSRWTTPTPW